MKPTFVLSLLALALLGGCASGGDPASAGGESQASRAAQDNGSATRLWLDRQSQGQQAAAKPQPLSGPVQEQIYERYQKSFTHPIPERFESERVNTGSSVR